MNGAPLVEPTWRPNASEITALQRIALPGGFYRRRTSYWTRAGAANINHNVMDNLRHHGAVRYASDDRALDRAVVTDYGRHVLAWIAQAEQERATHQAALKLRRLRGRAG